MKIKNHHVNEQSSQCELSEIMILMNNHYDIDEWSL